MICPKMAPNCCPDSRRDKGRIAVLCNPYRNAEAGQQGKPNGMNHFFRGPKYLLRGEVLY